MNDPRQSSDPFTGTGRTLPTELARLIQHLELAKSDWMDHALARLVEAVLFLRGELNADQVRLELHDSLGKDIESGRFHRVLQGLEAAGSIAPTSGPRYRLAEMRRKELKALHDEVLRLEETLRGKLTRIFHSHNIDDSEESLWAGFESLFLAPMLIQAGTLAYELILSQRIQDLPDASSSQVQLVRALTQRFGPNAREALVEFLDPDDAEVRELILGRLSGQYAREGAALDQETLDALAPTDTAAHQAKVFLDTNLLFTVLGLDANPADDAAERFLELARSARGGFQMKLYVLPGTIEEARGVLRDHIAKLSGVIPSRSVAIAASTLQYSGLDARFFEAASQMSTRTLTAESFFGPYERDMLTFLRNNGIELYNNSLADSLSKDQGVIDDLHVVEAFQKEHRKAGVKSYDANLHDMILWHFVDKKRPATIESPLDAVWWIATLDFGLVGFDRTKRRANGSIPTCLLPSAFVQLLQFWVPRSDDLDRAVVGSIREPLLFLQFDGHAEKVTMRIIRQLSRFSEIDDMSPDLVSKVLLNDALRMRMNEATTVSNEEELSLVESAIAEALLATEHELKKTRAEREAISTSAAENAVALQELEQRVRQEESDRLAAEAVIQQMQSEMERDRAESNLEKEKLSSAHLALRQASEDKVGTLERSLLHTRLAVDSVIVFAIGLVLTWVFEMILAHVVHIVWPRWTMSVGLALAISASLVELDTRRLGLGDKERVKRLVKGLHRSIWILIAEVATSFFANVLIRAAQTRK
jgi:hypothetical protein